MDQNKKQYMKKRNSKNIAHNVSRGTFNTSVSSKSINIAHNAFTVSPSPAGRTKGYKGLGNDTAFHF